MLVGLTIHDIVLIERLSLDLADGLCALTGETGAGKSILLDALGLAIGGRGDGGLVRQGQAQGNVTAVFELPGAHPALTLLAENSLDTEEGTIILRRIQSADGKTRAFINDQPVSVSLLRQVGDLLVEVHGQHDDRGLLEPKAHRALLDAFGGLGGDAAEVRSAFDAWRAAREAVDAHRLRLADAEREADYLRHTVDELDKLDPQPGEEADLAEERALMMGAERICEDLTDALETLDIDGGLESRLAGALRKLERSEAQAAGRLDEAVAALDRALTEAGTARDVVRQTLDDLQFDPQRLEQIEERLFALRALARKHNVAVELLPDIRERLSAELVAIERGEERLEELTRAAKACRDAYFEKASRLSKARAAAAAKLEKAVNKELPPLRMEKARFHVRIAPLPEETLGADGLERISFEVATNPGAAPGPLNKIASGGELSRFILALKVVLAARGSAPTLIFDEVDSGIGGAVADAVGERLAKLARDVQVLVVTHSPQVAARADHHLRISKDTGKKGAKSVRTMVEQLDADERLEEIARMLAGAQITDEARAAADRLIRGAA